MIATDSPLLQAMAEKGQVMMMITTIPMYFVTMWQHQLHY